MKPYISGKPALYIKDLVKSKKCEGRPFPLEENGTVFFFSARYALAGAAKALGVQRGDVILVPSYNCGVEIDPFLFLGLDLGFYNIKRDLPVDLDDLAFCIRKKRPKAVLATHFLGFPQPIEEIKRLCEDKGVFLIEDCAHAFLGEYKGKTLGSFGDVSVFSFLKTLEVPNGGALVVNREGLEGNWPVSRPGMFPTLAYLIELAGCRPYLGCEGPVDWMRGSFDSISRFSVKGLRVSLAGFRKLIRNDGNLLIRPDSFAFEEDVGTWSMSALSKRIIERANFKDLKEKRRKNFNFLLKGTREICPEMLFVNELAEGICPLFFPLIANGPDIRRKLYLRLREAGVVSHPWWDQFHPQVPWKSFPDAVYLKERVFGLPVHQGLHEAHLNITLDELKDALRRLGV